MNEHPVSATTKQVQPLTWLAPVHWLRAGARDFIAMPLQGMFYGGAFWLMALTIAFVFRSRPEYTMSIASGCLLVGPFLALGLYDLSRCRERGAPAHLISSLVCWKRHMRSLGLLVLILIVLELLWGRASLVVFAVFFNTGMPSTTGVMQAVFNPENLEFLVAYVVVGGAFAALVYAVSVVSMPMILDRDTDAITAAITSIEVVFTNTATMVVWGAIITTLIALAISLPWAAGLIVIGPLLGHSSWHAYRGAVRWQKEDEQSGN